MTGCQSGLINTGYKQVLHPNILTIK